MNQAKLNPAYTGGRPDIESMVPVTAKLVLDVGCSNGTLGAAIKAKTGAKVVGVELSSAMAAEARNCLDQVFVDDAAAVFASGKLSEFRFDTIIFADVLEHLVDPWLVLQTAREYLAPGGVIIASLPNIRHIDTIYNLVVKGKWPYRDRGIHDRTHLRFFTRQNILDLFGNADLVINRIETNYRLIEKPHRFNRFAQFIALPGLRDFLAFQYLIQAQLKS